MLPAKVPSGLPVIDETWGGLYRGGAYLLYGRAQSGNRLLALQFAQAAVEAGEACLFVSPSTPEALAHRADRLGLDLEDADDRLRRLHVAPMTGTPSDDALEQALADLASLVRAYAPSRLIIDDFAPFIRFQSFERFASAFFTLLDRLTGTTLILGMHTPPSRPTEHLVEFVQAQMTGVIEIDPSATAEAGTCTLVLHSGRFHAESTRVQNWTFGPRTGRPDAPQTAQRKKPASRTASERAALPSEPLVPSLLPESPPARMHAATHIVAGNPEPPDPDEPSGIHFFNLDDAAEETPDAPEDEPPDAPPSGLPPEPPESASPEAPPFDLPTGTDPFAYALADESAVPENAPPLFASLPSFLDEPLGPERGDSPPRRRFVRAFEAALVLNETTTEPFLAVALRMRPDSSAADRFRLVIRGMQATLGDAYALLADERRLRLVAVLPGRTPETAPALFAALKQFLHDVTPEGDPAAEQTFEETTAILLPNGRPFHTAAVFLAHAFDD